MFTKDMTDRDRELMPSPLSPRSANRQATPMGSSSVGTSSAGTSSSSSLRSNAFSECTELQTKNLDGDNCWACGTQPPHICHVVAQEDRQVGKENTSFKLGVGRLITACRRRYGQTLASLISRLLRLQTPSHFVRHALGNLTVT